MLCQIVGNTGVNFTPTASGLGGSDGKYRVLCERSAKKYQRIVLEKVKQNPTSSWLSFLKLKGLLVLEISKFRKIRKFQKKLFANSRLLNDYGLIITI